MTSSGFDTQRTPPYKRAGLVMLLVLAAVPTLVWLTFQGAFTPTTHLTLLSDRSGLVLDPGSKVTYNGVEIGQVAKIEEVSDTRPKAKVTLDVAPKYIKVIPRNVHAEITATTVFGNKYVALSAPDDPMTQRISSDDVIDVSSVTTEFNTLFESVMGVFEQVDPVKLNATLAAAADALDGLGDRVGQSIIDGNQILDELNPRMPQIRYDNQKLADLAEIYADASPDLWEFLRNSLSPTNGLINTLNAEQANLDAALLAAVGFGNTGADIFDRSAPYLIRGVEDLIPTSQLLQEYSPSIVCAIRNFAGVAPKIAAAFGGSNGYSLRTVSPLVQTPNPYVYPDNLPRANAKGGPGGKPGCWAPITRDLWPAPYLVMDSGASIAPYNHFELGQPLAIDYVWGRQIGEYTINP